MMSILLRHGMLVEGLQEACQNSTEYNFVYFFKLHKEDVTLLRSFGKEKMGVSELTNDWPDQQTTEILVVSD